MGPTGPLLTPGMPKNPHPPGTGLLKYGVVRAFYTIYSTPIPTGGWNNSATAAFRHLVTRCGVQAGTGNVTVQDKTDFV